jgi:uncharacterized protein (UPF0128 family)
MTIFELTRLLEARKIPFTLATFRDGAVTASCTVPGERWEIEIFEDGSVEFEVFHTAVEITGEAEMLARIDKFSD